MESAKYNAAEMRLNQNTGAKYLNKSYWISFCKPIANMEKNPDVDNVLAYWRSGCYQKDPTKPEISSSLQWANIAVAWLAQLKVRNWGGSSAYRNVRVITGKADGCHLFTPFSLLMSAQRKPN